MNDEYFYKVVCVDDTNPMEYRVLVDENVELSGIQGLIQRHKDIYIPNLVRWIITPFKKSEMKVINKPTSL